MGLLPSKDRVQQLINGKNLLRLCATPLIFRVVGYVAGLIVVNLLSKSDYGVWMYGLSFLEGLMLISGFGAAQGVAFFATRHKGTPLVLPYVRYGFIMGTLINMGIVLIGFFLLWIIPFPISQGVAVARSLIWFIIPFGMYTSLQGYASTTDKEQEYPWIRVVYTAGILLFPALGVLLLGVTGLILSEYLLYVGIVVFASILLGRRFWRDLRGCDRLNDDRRVEFISYSRYQVGSIMVTDLFYALDTLLVGILTGSVFMVAEYSVATLIPIALTAVPLTILQLTAPYIQESREDLFRLKKFYIRIVILLIIINTLLGIYLFFVVAPNIPNLFGEEYQRAIPVFRMLLLTSFISGTVRIPALEILAVLGKEKEQLQNNLFTGGLHLLLSIPFILFWGTTGAASSTLITIVVGSIMAMVSLMQLFYGGIDR